MQHKPAALLQPEPVGLAWACSRFNFLWAAFKPGARRRGFVRMKYLNPRVCVLKYTAGTKMPGQRYAALALWHCGARFRVAFNSFMRLAQKPTSPFIFSKWEQIMTAVLSFARLASRQRRDTRVHTRIQERKCALLARALRGASCISA